MTKMAAMPIYGKNPLKIFSRTSVNGVGTWYVALGVLGYHVCSIDDPSLTLTYLTSRSNLLPNTPILHRPRIPGIATNWQLFGFVAETYSVREDLN